MHKPAYQSEECSMWSERVTSAVGEGGTQLSLECQENPRDREEEEEEEGE